MHLYLKCYHRLQIIEDIVKPYGLFQNMFSCFLVVLNIDID